MVENGFAATCHEVEGVALLQAQGGNGGQEFLGESAAALAVGAEAGLPPEDRFVISDEANYVAQAVAFSQRETLLPGAAPAMPGLHVSSTYPPATAALQAMFVLLGGVGRRVAGPRPARCLEPS